MSFILDALRKSENERQRGAVPGIAHVPLAEPRATVPAWAIGAIGALGLAVVALAAAWWTASRAPDARVADAATVERPLAVPPPAAAQAPVAQAPVPQAAVAPEPARAQPESTLAAAIGLDRAAAPRPPYATEPSPARPAAALPSEAAPAPPRPRVVYSDTPLTGAVDAAPASSAEPMLPSAAALAAANIALPPLKLELHVFHPDRPADRLVIVNGRRYREGETLREGPRVEAIEATGAVLSYEGRRFMLTPD